MADEPPPMDYGETAQEEEAVEPEASQEKEIEQLPAESSQKPEEESSQTEPASLEPEKESEPAQLEPQSPPPVVEAHAADEGDEVPATDPLAKPEPQRTLDLFEEEPPAPQHTASQVHGRHLYLGGVSVAIRLIAVGYVCVYESFNGVVVYNHYLVYTSGTS